MQPDRWQMSSIIVQQKTVAYQQWNLSKKFVCICLNFCILGFVSSFKMMNLIDMCPSGVILEDLRLSKYCTWKCPNLDIAMTAQVPFGRNNWRGWIHSTLRHYFCCPTYICRVLIMKYGRNKPVSYNWHAWSLQSFILEKFISCNWESTDKCAMFHFILNCYLQSTLCTICGVFF
jgi:hypothetical protein